MWTDTNCVLLVQPGGMLKSETVDFVLAPPVGESSAKPLAVLLLDISCAPATLEAMKAAVLQVACPILSGPCDALYGGY